MGSGRTTPEQSTSSQLETGSGSTTEGEEDSTPARFADPSSEAQKQINAFIGNAETDSQPESRTDSPTETGAGVAGGMGAGINEPSPLENNSGIEADTGEGETSNTTIESAGVSAEEFTVDVAPGVADARNGGEFARATFSTGALSTRAKSDSDEWGVNSAPESGTGRYGSWEEFKQYNITQRRPLRDTSNRGGVTEDHMEVVDMSGAATDSYRAYVTDYARPAGPEDWQAQSQLTASTFAHACGVRAPNHTYDPDEEYVAAAGVNKLGQPEAEPVAVIDAEKASKVDRDEFLDICAVQQLAGNNDLHFENIFVDDEGGVHCIDYDRGRKEYSDMATLESSCHKANSTANQIDRNRKGGFNVDKSAIADRAQEIAVALEVSGQKERVLQSISEYDELFPNTDKQHAEVIRHNINIAVDAARRN